MELEGWYYLHTNGDLIHKIETGETHADIRESTFAVAMWPVYLGDRAAAWRILVEGLAAGANPERVKVLAEKWGCDNDDAKIYAERIGAVVAQDQGAWYATRKDFVNLQESPNGWGDSALEALAALAKELGYKPAKMWGNDFAGLLKLPEAKPVR